MAFKHLAGKYILKRKIGEKIRKVRKLRVWWIPQVPMKPFYVDVKSPFEAKKILDVLGKYDLFQLKNNIKPDFSNAGGLQEYNEEEKEWYDWEDENGDDIDNTTIY